MLMTGESITRSFHEILMWNIKSTDAIQNDMNMNVACIPMTIRMCTDEYLMSWKVVICKCHPEFLSTLRSQTVFITVARIEANNVVMCLDFLAVLIFTKLSIGQRTVKSIALWCAVDTVNQIFIT